MDFESQPLKIFLREAILRTPQGWVVLGSFVINWALVAVVTVMPREVLIPNSGMALVYVVLLPWPFAVLLAFVMFSSPNYQASFFACIATALLACAPYWWVYA